MSDLPSDMVEEILCRLPATSLKKLRWTCKLWNSLFNDKRFTKKHSEKATKQFLVLMLKENRVCSLSVNLHGIRSIELIGERSLIEPHHYSLDQLKISNISYCDGLLLCTNNYNTQIVVWNPCTGQTRWIPPSKIGYLYALGSYQDNKSGDNSYKILCINDDRVHIYEINSKSWRTLDVTLDCYLEFTYSWGMYLKGKTYWFASDYEDEELGIFIVSFDYRTERFECMLLPCQGPRYEEASLSVVREEKLSVLLQHTSTSKAEIWVTNKIDETKVVSWSKFLTFDLEPTLSYWSGISFLVDEEKNFLVYCDINVNEMLYIFGEDNEVKPVNLESPRSSYPILFNYVPSLTQIQQSRSKTKRGKREKIKRNQV